MNLNDQYAPCFWLFWIVVMTLVAISSQTIIQTVHFISNDFFNAEPPIISVKLYYSSDTVDLKMVTIPILMKVQWKYPRKVLKFFWKNLNSDLSNRIFYHATYQEHSSPSTDLEMMKDRNECFRIISRAIKPKVDSLRLWIWTILLVFCP